jgi:Biotin carboxyl carrier protein
MVGVFHRSPEPGAPPFVDVGDTVVPGQQVAIVEAMKLMIPVKADTDGVVEQVLKESGEHVQYGERLFAVVPPDGD